MFPVVYETAKWIGLVEKRFIFSHVLNRRLNPEEHSHEFFEIIFLFSGTAEHRVGGTVKHLEAGDITFLRPGDTHVFIGQSEAIELYSISVVSDEILRFLKTYHSKLNSSTFKIPLSSPLTLHSSRGCSCSFAS